MSVKLNLSYPVAKSTTPVVEKALEKPRTNVTPVADVEDQGKGSETEQGKLKAAVQEIEKFVQSVKRNLEFSIDEASGQVVVRVIA
ncbi:flagellar protein FlaG, partial [Pseudomonas putida]